MNLDRIKKRLRALFDRIKYYNGASDNESENAEALAKELMQKYGLTEEDVKPENEKKQYYSRLQYVPNLELKKNPNWFNVLISLVSQHCESRAIQFTDELGCILVGAEENLKRFKELLDLVIERSSHTFRVISAFNKVNKPDYMLGFAYGFNHALIEEEQKKEAEENAKQDKEDSEKLMIISFAIVEIDRKIGEETEKGNITAQNNKQEIKDQNSFLLGFCDGKLALSKLIERG